MDGRSKLPRLEWNGWVYEVRKDVLEASCAGSVKIRLPLAPLIEGNTSKIAEWRKVSTDHFAGSLDVGGSVHLSIDCGHLCFWMETDIKEFKNLTYFPHTTFDGKYWQTYMSDHHDRRWDVDIDQEVGLASAYDDLMNPFGADGEGMTDPGDFPPYLPWNVPPRIFSFHTNEGWVGFSMPGALPVGVVRLTMNRRMFSISFDVLRPSCPDGIMPRVYIVTGLACAYDALDEHRMISNRLGLTVEKNPDHPAWWTNPEYKYWDEYLRHAREDPEGMANRTLLTKERYLDWLNTTKQITGIRGMNACMEQGCYNCYGDYRPIEAMGGVDGVRRMIDELRTQGTHMGYYLHPYIVNTRVDFYSEHPEAFCTPKDSSHRFEYALEYGKDKPEFALLDMTHPLARNFLRNQLEFILSNKPGCLNADILKSNHWRSPDPRVYDFHDPDWGIGDLMTCKVQRFIYEAAKEIKPECMVSKVALGDPYIQPWADADYLCEEWNGYTDNWYRRGRIATRTMKGMLFLTDAYFVTLTKGYEYYMGMMAWNYPQTNTVRHAVHPYTHYRECRDKDFKRRNAGFHTAANAPLRVGDLSRVTIMDDGEVQQWRKRTRGELAGFYAALAIGKRTLVTYSETEARVASSISRRIEFPLPPGVRIEMVEMVPHEGSAEEWEWQIADTAEGRGVRMQVEDCGKMALYYRVAYSLDV